MKIERANYFHGGFREAYLCETERGLRAINMFERSALIETAKKLSRSDSFHRVLGKEARLLHEEELLLSPSQQVGLADENWIKRQLCADDPIRIACSVSCAGANAILRYLRDVKDYHIEIDNAFVHALEIANRIAAADPLIDHDLCVIASAPAASLLKLGARCEYVPITFLPAAAQRLIAPKNALSGRVKREQLKEMILFTTRALSQKREVLRALLVSVRNAWLELAGDRSLLESSLSEMFSDPSWENLLRRCSGL